MSALSHGKGVMPAVFDFSVQGNIGRIRTETGSYSSATEQNGISLGKIEDSRNLVY
jgi:deoxyhypusine synthase